MAHVVPEPFNYLGFILVVVGAGLNIWTDALFKKEKTTVKPHEMPTTLLVSGPFKVSRHPMYLGMVIILLGLFLYLGSLITLVYPVVFFLLMERLFIPVEEKNLEMSFGPEYHKYRAKVHRWI
ncbi:methyltransferase family protein [Methanomethylovorans sp.]|uniref:methyltransferase family protein n=1 Tax=Methanomethylovorans sp. TaxID=2758717 RepID=UPI002FDE23E9